MIETVIQQLLDGLTVGIVYVLIAAGLSVIFGVMNVINFAHGELFALGAYFALAIIAPLGGGPAFFIALMTAPLLVGAIGFLIERFTVRPLYGRNPLYHILLTFGLVFVINDSIYLIWGTGSTSLPRPEILTGSIELIGFTASAYNMFIIIAGSAMAAVTWGILRYTKYGLIIRAGSQDRQMVRNLGITIDKYYSLVFGGGAALAAFAGIILAGRQSVNPELGMGIIIPAFVIVVLGGLGSFRGAVAGGLLVGILQESILRPYFPVLEGTVIFILMILVILIRPQGLFGTEFEEEGAKGLMVGAEEGGLLSQQTRIRLGIAMVALLALFPLGAGWLYSAAAVSLVYRMVIWGLFALSLDFVMGYTGLVSLGHALFWALGAYISGIVLFHFTEMAIVAFGAAVLVGAVVAWVIGFLSIRIHGVYFAMITLAFAELYYNILYRVEITGGSEGLFGFSAFFGVGDIGLYFRDLAGFYGPIQVTVTSVYIYMALTLLVASYFLMRRMLRSPFGTVLKAIRENEERARFLGYDVTAHKRRAFTVSGTFATVAGVLYALNSGFVSPEAGEWLKSGEVIVMVILGGMGTLYGPIIGAFAFFGLENVITDFTRRWRLMLGLIFVFFVIFLPRGLISVPSKLMAYAKTRSDPDPAVVSEAENEQTTTGGND